MQTDKPTASQRVREARAVAERDANLPPCTCAECGHDHWFGVERGYDTCPIDECGCKGQPRL